MGFLVEPRNSTYNPDGLPVGFAKRQLGLGKEPYSCWRGNWVGFACAACHTGQVNYRGYQLRIEGGAAHHDIEAFGARLSDALGALASSDAKLARFLGRVFASVPDKTSDEVGAAVRCYAKNLRDNKSFFEIAQSNAKELPTASGFGRLDAHERGVNLFLAAPLKEPRNYVPETAPVSFPAVWDTPYFDWVLYNAAIRQPIARNVIEALGVQAPIDHTTIFSGFVAHAVNVDNIVKGQRIVMDLMSPQWPEDILGAIDKGKASRGSELYRQQCIGCHAIIDRTQHAVASTVPGGDHRIAVTIIPQDKINTDPRQAATFANRTVDLSKIGGPPSLSSFQAGQAVTEKIVTQWITESEDNAARAQEVNQGRPNEFRGLLQYRARPLNGIWATAPYLHNGSVPNLRELLMPADRRTKILYMGNWEFDPVNVGLEARSPFPGATVLDTRLPGNSNAGHEFGTALGDADRDALIEYLKTL
jgi:hypothetical protein